jgi:hypothetical protein
MRAEKNAAKLGPKFESRINMETFEEAKAKFSKFLETNNRPKKIVWIYKEDISQIGGLTLYKVSNSALDETFSRRLYEEGVKRGLGVTISSQFYPNERTAAYVWWPKDTDEAMRYLQAPGLKLTVLQKQADPRRFKELEIKSNLLWAVLKRLHQNKNPISDHFQFIPEKGR